MGDHAIGQASGRPTGRRAPRRLGSLGALALLVTGLAFISGQAAPAGAGSGVVTGTVFRDFNSDGFYNTTASASLPAVDVGMAGVTVRAFDSTGAQVASATTGATGTYTLNYTTGDATTAVRIEFDTPTGYQSGPHGSGSGTRSGGSVQFKTTGQTASYGVHQTGGDFSRTDPVLVIPVARGLSRGGGISALVPGTAGTLYATNYSTTGVPTEGTGANNLRKQATRAQTGNVWGTAPYNDDRVFSAAFFKRHTPLGPGGLGQIYLTDIDTGTPNATAWVTIPNVGTNPRGSGETDPAYDWFHDINAYPNVYKVGLGDIDLSADRTKLYAVNLNDRQLYAVPIFRAANPANPPTAGTPVAIAMPLALPGAATGCAQAQVRPFGLHTDTLGVWAGLTCTGPTAADLRGYVYRYDEGTGQWGTSPAVEFGLGGNRGKTWTGAFGANNANWRPWADNFNDGVSGSSYSDPQPVISDLEFDSNGDLSIGVKDRTGDRVGMDAGNLTSGSTSTYEGFDGGDLMRACVSGSTWVLESAGGCGSRTGYSTSNNQGPGGGEFYNDDYSTSHAQTMLGSVEQVPGFTDVLGTSFDPASAVRVSGYRKLSNANGSKTSQVEVTGDGRGNQTTCAMCAGTFGKADGLGDIEALLEDGPIEIGNRIWHDDDRDGLQDADEAVFAGATVLLYDAADDLVGTTTTDSAGQYWFNDGNVTGGLLQETDYTIRLLASEFGPGELFDRFVLTGPNQGGPANDDIDSDAFMAGGVPLIALTTGGPGADDHTFDIGLNHQFDLALRKVLLTAPSTVEPGDDVTFEITIFNQGDETASEVTITDTLPPGTTLDDPAWTDEGGGVASFLVEDALDPGESTSVPITLRVDRPQPDGTITNTAEISHALDADGDEVADVDSTADDDAGDDPLVDDEIDDDGAIDEDDHDIATVDLETPAFDLALRKRLALAQSPDVAPGADATFDLTVFNQGDAEATAITITDTLPPHTSLNDPDWTDNGDGTASITLPGSLLPGADTTVAITLQIDGDAPTGDFVNQAEISSAHDRFGGDGDDVDSTPDTDPDNDPLIDDEIDGNANTGDEDDHDVASVRYDVFDLALRKRTTAGQVRVGDLVPFEIEVFNQGTVDATGIVVTDHLPPELGFNAGDNPEWTLVGGHPTTTVDGPLAPGASTTVTLQLEVIATATEIENRAEISAAAGPDGLEVTDLDSTPDTDPDDDPLVDDEIDDDGTTDEDDHDIATIGAPAFDLALRKTTASDVVAPGELVAFDIEVFNQGQQEASDIVVTDHVPTGMAFDAADNPGWAEVAGNPTTTIDGPLAVDDSTTVTIWLRVGDDAMAGTLTNTAEISTASDENGPVAIDRDSTPDTDGTDDLLEDDRIDDDGTTDEDDHDVASVRVAPFDLALRKVLSEGQASTVEPGDPVTFSITAYNQGEVDATDVVLTDTLPPGTALDDANWTDQGDGTATRTIASLPAGDAVTVTLTLVVDRPAAATGTFTNTVEISDALDGEGIDRIDEDSTPDADPDDDTLVDDVLDNAGGDEDDHDIAEFEVDVPAFDLALRKTLAQGQATQVRPGQDATFTITVFNQGETPAHDVTVTDTLPPGTSLADADWTDNGDGTASHTFSATLAAGGSVTIDLTLHVDDATGPGTLTNTAEISAALDHWDEPGADVDSTADTDPDGDLLVDDEIDDDGTTDEDDHDVATLEVPTFDLALRKTVDDDIVGPGQPATFTITVFNQGEMPAADIVVTDEVPAGFSFDVADNPGWADGPNGPTTTIAGPLAPGDAAKVTITLGITATSAAEALVNHAEITSATDELGVTRTDLDSTPDADRTNDALVDDEIDDDGTLDEDDHDVASVRLFDLALRKTTTSNATHVGDHVPFTITVFNQGRVAASSFTVTDYLPAQLGFDAGDNPGWALVDGNPTITVDQTLLPGESTTVELDLVVTKHASRIDNFAEISDDAGPSGVDVVDVDSDGDTENADPLIDNEIDSPDDEDDHDIASVTAEPFDLALRKTTASDVVAPGQLVTFDLEVFNQGEQDATDIVVTDTPPAGLTFDPADNPGWSLVGGRPTTTVAGPLAAGDATTVTIALRVQAGATAGTLTNHAEVSGATDEQGRPAVDVDSLPDTDAGNDPLVDDEIANADGDEDDHDIASVRVLPFDLALRKTLAPGQSATVEPGDPISYSIEVFNQGQVTAADIEITDTLPAGTTLADANWTDNGDGTVRRTLVGPIAPDGSLTATLRVLVDRPAPNGTITNAAEITTATDDDGVTRVDEDSSGDLDPSNDPLVDDEIDDDGTTDEDDEDIAEVTLDTPAFDLALRKERGADQAAQVRAGQDATFTITVFNQGDAEATSIQVIDRLPAGTTLADPDWTDNGDGTASITLPGSLAPGADTHVDLTLTVDATTAPGTLTNSAEISAANDRFGGAGADVDSTPDDDLDGDRLVDDEIDDDGTTDEDDHDVATLEVPTFDLALRKTTDADIVAPGQHVTFTLEVFNQGQIPAAGIEVTDAVPAGFTFAAADNPGWSLVGGRPTTTISGPVAAGGSATVEIDLVVVASADDGAYDNRAEISDATDDLGIGRPDVDSTPDVDPDDDLLVDDEIDDDGTTDEDDHDVASVRIFDLALRKTTDATQAQVGDLVTFDIEVFNQGNVTATDVVVADELPEELAFDAAANPAWSLVGGVPRTTIAGAVEPGTSASVSIDLRVVANADRIDNFAEVADAAGPQGEPVTDIDSTPNTDPDDDVLVDNEIANGGDDEDDHDIASVGSPIFDLALRKTLAAGQSAIVWPGDAVTFDLEVFNQGDQAAHDIVVTDALPAGTSFDAADNPGWSLVGGQPTTTLAGPVAPGASVTVSITITVDADTTPRLLQNRAEISAAADAADRPGLDVDSSPDADLDGDPVVDDVIDGRDGDEDDHDVAEVTVPTFDLALRKTLADGQPATAYLGDEVTFTITVFNQGSVGATDVVVADTLPDGLAFDAADNPGWALVGDQPTRTIAGPIAPDGQASVDLVLTVTRKASALVNQAEIVAAEDAGGTPRTDIDSTPDTDPGNDELTDDVIDETPASGDEDDQDVAEVAAPTFDLALRKTLADDQPATAYVGEDVTFTITVFNQGSVTATDIEVVDRLPEGLSFDDAINPGWSEDAGLLRTTIAGPLAPDGSASVDLVLGVEEGVPASVDNLAEIALAHDTAGRTPPDVDSTPDADLDGDLLVDDEIDDDGTVDEDDHDIAPVTTPVWDLALRKSLASGQAATVRPGGRVAFTLRVFNQGTVAAHDVVVRDALPEGLVFSADDNPGWTMASGAPVTTIAGPIEPGSSAAVQILLRLSQQPPATIVNVAEILDAVDEDDHHPVDLDSIGDEDPDDDTLVDDEIDNASGDEDDNDVAEVRAATVTATTTTTIPGQTTTTSTPGNDPDPGPDPTYDPPADPNTPTDGSYDPTGSGIDDDGLIGSDLVKTGMEIGQLVAIGLGLILAGALFARRSRRRWA